MDELAPTKGAEWRKPREEGLTVEFPSGKVARIRPFGLDAIVKIGYIPDSLTPLVMNLIDAGGWMPMPDTPTLEERQQYFTFLDKLAEAMFVSPRVVTDPQTEDEISPDDIQLDDKVHLWITIGQPARVLVEYFRALKTQSVGSMAPTETHEPASQPDTASEAVGVAAVGDAG